MRIRAYYRRSPLVKPYRLSFATLEYFDTFYIHISDGTKSGWGEITPLPGYSDESASTVRAAIGLLEKGLKAGQRLETVALDLERKNPFVASGIFCAIETFDEGFEEAFTAGIAAPIELTALCDGQTEREMIAAAKTLTALGYKALKLKIGSDSTSTDISRIRAVSSVIDKSVALRLDANQGLSLDAAVEICRAVQELPVQLVEQPFPPENLDDLRSLINQTSVPIMLDESISGINDVDMAAEVGAKLIKLKLCKHPGMRATADLIRYAVEKHNLGVVFGNGVQTVLGNHLEARVFARCQLSLPSESNGFMKLKEDVASHRLHVRDGHLIDGGMAEPNMADADRLIDCAFTR